METNAIISAGERATGEIEEERQLLRMLVDQLPAQIFVKDNAARYLLCNRAHVQMSGAKDEAAMVGKSVFDFYPLDLAQAFDRDDQELLRTGIPVIRPEESYGTQRKGRWYSLTKVPLRDDGGEIIGLVGIKDDITERKLAEQALRESEAAFSMIFRSSPALISIATVAEGRLIHVNQRYCEFFGFSSEEMVGKTVRELNLWANPADRQEAIRRLREEGAIHGLDARCRLRSGEVRHVLGSMELIDLAGESEPILISMFTDITERKRAEERLAEERKMLRTMIDHLPANVFVKDTAGRYLLVNTPHRRQLGLATETQMLGKTSFEFFPEEIARQFAADDQTVIQTGQPVIEREEPYEAGGKRGWFLTTKVPLRDPQGNITGLVGIAQEITERKRAEDVIRQRTEELERFHRLSVGRELQMIELKKEINELARLAGRPPPYQLPVLQDGQKPQPA